MVNDQELKRFIEKWSKELKLEILPFAYDLKERGEGELAKLILTEEGDPLRISLSKDYIVSFDLYYQIARELRRAWQRWKKPLLLQGYRSQDELSHEEFYLQKAEIDAHAYASMVLIDEFRIKPLFEGLPQKAVIFIRHRIEELADERENPEYYEE